MGRIGFVPCPRDEADLAAIAAWGARAVLTLVEEAELARLGMSGLGAAVLARGLAWEHLPIPDFGLPGPGFEAAWTFAGARLRTTLRTGGDVLVHCRGGLGRSGTIAARLLVELGAAPPAAAIARIRAARPGAIETPAQEARLRQGFV